MDATAKGASASFDAAAEPPDPYACPTCGDWWIQDDAGRLVCPTTTHCLQCGEVFQHDDTCGCPTGVANCPFCGVPSCGTDTPCHHYIWTLDEEPTDLGAPVVAEAILEWPWTDAELETAFGALRPLFAALVEHGSDGDPKNFSLLRAFGHVLITQATAPLEDVLVGGWGPGSGGGLAYFSTDPEAVRAEIEALLHRFKVRLAVLTAR